MFENIYEYISINLKNVLFVLAHPVSFFIKL